MKKLTFNRSHVATFIALLFHVSGFIGMISSKRAWFVQNTTLNLLLMFVLIIWTHSKKSRNFFYFLVIAFAVGMVTEIIGVNTGLLFGNYTYGEVLGPGIFGVPWLIGINWATIMYCCAIMVTQVYDWMNAKTTDNLQLLKPWVRFIAFVMDGALLATLFDFILEPVAIKLGYWTWLHGDIPFINFLCWFGISALLMTVFKLLRFPGQNQFAVHLLLIEMLFFLALRTYL